MMPRFFGPLPVVGDGSEENPYQPGVPQRLLERIDDYVDWGAWYYPQNPPYEYCMVTVWKVKKMPPNEVKLLERTLDYIKTNYPQFYKSLKQSYQSNPDPAPESWNFDSDTVGQMPSGWTLLAGSMQVQNDQYVSSPNSFKANTGGTTGAHISKAGASRTDLMVKSQIRVNWDTNATIPNVDVCWRLADADNFYEICLKGQTCKLRKRVNGSFTELASVSYSWSTNTWYELKAEMQGTNARGYVNGVQVVPATGWQAMGSDFSSGVIGVRIWAGATDQNAWFDDVYVEDYGVIKTVTDSLSLSDAALTDKTLQISDAVGLEDTPLKGWVPQITDVILLADQILRDKTFAVSDSISLSELVTAITEIIKYVADAIGLSDTVLVHKTLLIVTDSLGLSDLVLVNKILQIADQIGLSEVVTKIVPTAAKTKIFLIIGDLAVQLTGG